LSDIRAFLARLAFVEKKGIGKGKAPLDAYEKKFHAAMEDDLNTPEALAAIFELMRESNKGIWDLDPQEARRLRLWLHNILEMFGFRRIDLKIPAKVNRLAAKREAARRNQQFMQSDDLRKEVEELGYSIEDTPLGPLILPLPPKTYKL
jgi:cysteinyl-tRNA synthetase